MHGHDTAQCCLASGLLGLAHAPALADIGHGLIARGHGFLQLSLAASNCCLELFLPGFALLLIGREGWDALGLAGPFARLLALGPLREGTGSDMTWDDMVARSTASGH